MEKIKQNPFVKKVGFNRIVLCCVLLLMYGLFCALTGGKLRRNEPNHERTQLCLFPWIFITGCYICNCYRTDRLLYWTGYVLLCTYLRLYTDNTWNFHAGCNLISILVGFAFGLFNGYLVAYWSVPSFITSMASMNIAKGLASVYTKTQSVSWPQAAIRTTDGSEIL